MNMVDLKAGKSHWNVLIATYVVPVSMIKLPLLASSLAYGISGNISISLAGASKLVLENMTWG